MPTRLMRSLFALLVSLACASAFAQAGKPVKILVGFPPGGGTDADSDTPC